VSPLARADALLESIALAVGGPHGGLPRHTQAVAALDERRRLDAVAVAARRQAIDAFEAERRLAAQGRAAAAQARESTSQADAARPWPFELLDDWTAAEVARLVVGAGVTTVRRLRPVYARQFADIAARAFREVNRHRTDVRRLKLLFLLPLMCIGRRSRSRGGRGGKARTGRALKSRLRRLAAGDWAPLLEDLRRWASQAQRRQAGQHDRAPAVPDADADAGEAAARQAEALDRRVRALVAEGELSRAMRALDPAAHAPATQQTMEQLRTLHPSEPPHADGPLQPADFKLPAGVPPLELDRPTFDETVRRLPRFSAHGGDGWRFEHIQAM
jgi:hypothetical protein